MKALLLSYSFDGTDVGEALMAFKWAEALADRVELTVLGLERRGQPSLAEKLPQAKVVTWPEPAFFLRAPRFNAMLKPAYPLLYRHVRRWLKTQFAQGVQFDIAHQIMPQAARYPCPFHSLDLPYLIGPLGGALEVPEGFKAEMTSDRWYVSLRGLDHWRLRHDPWLRRSYTQANAILGVAPYMQEILSDIPMKRFEPVLELGIDNARPPRQQLPRVPGRLELVHVGRGVRSKGLRDVVRAMAQLKDLPDIRLTSAGSGPELALAEQEARELGVEGQITFLGQISKAEVEALYDASDVFVFPSFREPAGGVLYEAMRSGLPVVTVNYGGPGFIVDDTCGLRLPLSGPEALARDLAATIRSLYHTPDRIAAMGRAARDKVLREGLWTEKANEMVQLYQEILNDTGQNLPLADSPAQGQPM